MGRLAWLCILPLVWSGTSAALGPTGDTQPVRTEFPTEAIPASVLADPADGQPGVVAPDIDPFRGSTPITRPPTANSGPESMSVLPPIPAATAIAGTGRTARPPAASYSGPSPARSIRERLRSVVSSPVKTMAPTPASAATTVSRSSPQRVPYAAPVQPVSLAPVEPIRPYVQPSVAATMPRYYVEPPEVRMAREIAPWVAELTKAIRPTTRMDAATALAEGRYGWRDEVKAYLVSAATNDPAAVVRAHCISLLTTLGYATPEYKSFLATCSADRSPDVRVAAVIALARLEPR